MSSEMSGSLYEKRLQQEIQNINTQIRDLSNERSALERQLIKARQENAGVKDVSRLNSINRVMIERRIIEALSEKSPLRSQDLFREAQKVTFDLKESTFRTHLHRLKNKGVIQNAGRFGIWKSV